MPAVGKHSDMGKDVMATRQHLHGKGQERRWKAEILPMCGGWPTFAGTTTTEDAPPLLLLQRACPEPVEGWAAMPPVARGRVDRFIATASVIVVLSVVLVTTREGKRKSRSFRTHNGGSYGRLTDNQLVITRARLLRSYLIQDSEAIRSTIRSCAIKVAAAIAHKAGPDIGTIGSSGEIVQIVERPYTAGFRQLKSHPESERAVVVCGAV